MKVKDTIANAIFVVFFLLLLGLPMASCLIGILLIFQSLEDFRLGELANGLARLSFGMAFLSGGLFAIHRIIRSGKLGKREQKLSEKYPHEPWKWREDWARGEVGLSEKFNMLGLWIVPILWFSMTGFPTYMALSMVWKDGSIEAALVFLILLLISVGILIYAIRQTVRWWKFGRAVFRMDSVPAVPGGPLKGNIHTFAKLFPPTGICLRLYCVEIVSKRRNDSTRVVEDPVWEGEWNVPREALGFDHRGLRIPVTVQIPGSYPETSYGHSSKEIVWRLEASASVPGVDYKVEFEVPVFRVQKETAGEDQ